MKPWPSSNCPNFDRKQKTESIIRCCALQVVYGLNPVARWRYRKLPGPRPQWLFGNLREVIKKGNHQAYTDWQRSYGSVFRVRSYVLFEKLCAA